MTRGEATGAIDYLISWPLSQPINAWRAGEDYHPIAQVLAAAIGVPFILVAFVLGPFVATVHWLLSD
ncbi:hypothetical protein [Haloarcula amylovorans]|uniref:hypothetical protein n=1 Tax=Haloarcula amylovorans TaxID=2562280 RepID=UPI001076A8B3|nr:hypothetical protein [Halomicroarcula amylolytica]